MHTIWLTLKSGRVAAGAIAEKCQKLNSGVGIVAFTSSIGDKFLFPPTATHPSPSTNPEFLTFIEKIDWETVDSFAPVRCPHPVASQRMAALVKEFKANEGSIGGTVT